MNINLIYCHLEKIAELILKEDLFKIFLLYIPYLSEPKIILFLFSICSNLIDYDTSMNSNQFFVFTRVNTDFRSVRWPGEEELHPHHARIVVLVSDTMRLSQKIMASFSI